MTRKPPAPPIPRPSRALVSIATLLTQLLGAVAVALAFVWIVKLGDRRPMTLTVLLFGAVCAFTGGIAHRGSITSLVACAGFDLTAGVVCLAKHSALKAFVATPLAWLAPSTVHDLAFALGITGGLSFVAAGACISAVPQLRRFIAWQNLQLVQAARAAS